MNVLTKIRLIKELNEKELRLGVVGTSSSWHNQYKNSAWIYVGSLPYELSEGDVICVFSQYGEIVNINLIRDKKTGKSKGFAFVCYEDQRSTVLAVDNLNGTKIKGRQLRVDHVLGYKVPKEDEEIDELTMQIREKGVAPSVMEEYETAETDEIETVESYVVDDVSEEDKPKKKKKKKEKKKEKGLSFLKEKPNKEKERAKELPPKVTNDHDTGDRERDRRYGQYDRYESNKDTTNDRTDHDKKRNHTSKSASSRHHKEHKHERNKSKERDRRVEDKSHEKKRRRRDYSP